MRSTLVAVGLALLACTPVAEAVTGQRTVSFRNSRPLLPDDVYRAQLQAARGISCLPALPPGINPPPGLQVPIAPRQLTFAAALASAQKVAGLNGARARKLRANPLFKKAVGAERLAVAGLLAKADKGALAALLLTAERNPRDPLPLIDAAALLIDARKPNEALALLTQARKLPQRKLKRLRGRHGGRPGDQPRGGLLPHGPVRAGDLGRPAGPALEHLARRGPRERRHGPALPGPGAGGRLRVPRRHEAPAGAGRGAADVRRGARHDARRLRLHRRHPGRLSGHRLSGAAQQGGRLRHVLRPPQHREQRALLAANDEYNGSC